MSLVESITVRARNVPVAISDMPEAEDGCAAAKVVANKNGSRALLMALIYHHGTDANMHPPKGWVKATPESKKPDPVKEKFWFKIESDDEPDLSELEPLKIEDVKREVCRYFGLRETDLLSQRRCVTTTRPRQMAMFLSKKFTGRSLPEIGRRLGGRDHTTVLSAVRRISKLCMADWVIAYDIAHLEVSLSGRFQCEP